MSKPELKWLDRNVIQGPFFVLCLNDQEWRDAFEHLELPVEGRPPWIPQGQGITSVCHTPKGLACVVGINLAEEDHHTTVALGLVVHEATHVFQEWAADLGEESPSAEFMAYSIQHFSQELMQSYQDKLGVTD
ncbi:MAG: hypothetical protein ACI4QS_10835 [Comamonas sp.]